VHYKISYKIYIYCSSLLSRHERSAIIKPFIIFFNIIKMILYMIKFKHNENCFCFMRATSYIFIAPI
jgi:hypothetical protein